MQKLVDGVLVDLTAEEADAREEEDAAYAAGQVGRLLGHNALRRLRKETGGLVHSGQSISTTRESQALIAGAGQLAAADQGETFKFKSMTGWLDLDAAGMQGLFQAVLAHVNNAFKLEAAIANDIAAGAVTTFAEIDALWDAEEA